MSLFLSPKAIGNTHDYIQMLTFYWNLEATDDYSCQKLNVLLTRPVWIDFICSLNTEEQQ